MSDCTLSYIYRHIQILTVSQNGLPYSQLNIEVVVHSDRYFLPDRLIQTLSIAIESCILYLTTFVHSQSG